ncbi:hypothetical protein LEP1GSC188_0405 [Leptospira weilii serovar Topaz str. LT2116]|uniref:Uncharacterized protein n=1 Tax=Leptospira weilii serovar Topaz str. LT2116 TaxID=1088540 RepID=M3GTS4_9LEPT|nr:hypothetical protein LEP1GSC188_0405 [Leptospira weilii serovar Topaz str. LT2116]
MSDYSVDSNYNPTGSGRWNREEVTRRRGSGIPSLVEGLDISKLEKQQARNEARGRLSRP